MRKVIIFVFVVFLAMYALIAYAGITNAQEANNISDEEVLNIVDLEDQDRVDTVRKWLNQNNESEYPTLYPDAQQFVSSIEEERENIERNLSGTKRISEDVRVIGYEFDQKNETVTFAVELDEDKTLIIQDISETISGEGSFSWQNRDFEAGVHRIQIESVVAEFDSVRAQAIGIADAEAQTGNVIKKETNYSVWNELEWWMIPLAAVSAGFALLLLIIRKVKNMDEEGINEFIPLE